MHRTLAIVLLIILCTACSSSPSQSPLSSPLSIASPVQRPQDRDLPPIVITDDNGAITGRIVGYPRDWTGRELTAYACPYFPMSTPEEGFYILEPSVHPSGVVTSLGRFQITGVAPQKYVIVVGPGPEEAKPLAEEGRPEIFEVGKSSILELGDIDLR